MIPYFVIHFITEKYLENCAFSNLSQDFFIHAELSLCKRGGYTYFRTDT